MDDGGKLAGLGVAGPVRRGERSEDARAHVQGVGVADALAAVLLGAYERLEGHAGHVLEHEGRRAVEQHEIVEANDGGVRQSGVGDCLCGQPAEPRRVVRVSVDEALENDRPLEAMRAVDAGEEDFAALAERDAAHDAVRSDVRPFVHALLGPIRSQDPAARILILV